MRQAIVACARSYLGVQWLHQGRSRLGLDCAGLIVRVARDLGLSDFDVTGYGKEPQGNALRAILEQHSIAVEKPEVGDILLLRFTRLPQHLAIVTDYGIIHTHRAVGRVVEHGLDRLWRARLVAAFAYPGVH
jgi:cell wall-associated NlpC family hydrolase